jgi:rhodanese-related sulfurtransferase
MERSISTEELKSKLSGKQSIKVVETLAPDQYAKAHIPGAVNIPPDKIKELAAHVLPDKNVEIVTYCSNTH